MLEKPAKNWVKIRFTKFLWDFQFLGVFARFEAYYRVSGPAGPKTAQKPQTEAKKRILGITLARQKIYKVFVLKSVIFEGARPF